MNRYCRKLTIATKVCNIKCSVLLTLDTHHYQYLPKEKKDPGIPWRSRGHGVLSLVREVRSPAQRSQKKKKTHLCYTAIGIYKSPVLGIPEKYFLTYLHV